MDPLMRVLACSALGLTVLPPLLFLAQQMEEPIMKHCMLAGTILWFLAAPWALKGGAR
ncbi:MAG: hypothetical protein RMN51_06565 [Verrucomicrobiota bacterium]|nr:hypothetical protein [Limisphaera sp.]MDW8381754.1 hypothetical protein [Verrucomicrobiota bacterium]